MPDGEILVRSGDDWYHLSVFLDGIQHETCCFGTTMNVRFLPTTIEFADVPALS